MGAHTGTFKRESKDIWVTEPQIDKTTELFTGGGFHNELPID